MSNIAEKLKRGSRLRVGLPFLTYEFSLEDLSTPEAADARIARLGEIKRDLEGAIRAVQELQKEAGDRKAEADQLQALIAKLQADRTAAESLLQVPEEAFSRLVSRATKKGRLRGLLEGVLVGFLTGTLSSAFVWYLTR